MVLVDTSIWSLALRRKSKDLAVAERRLTESLYRMVDDEQVLLLGPVRQELLSGLREESEFKRLRGLLRGFPDVPISTHDYEEAARFSNRCRRAGIAATSVDMLLCAVALRQGWQIFTTDRDFNHYAAVLNINLIAVA